MKFVLTIAFVIACIGVEVWASDDDDALTEAAKEKCKGMGGGISAEELEQLKDGEFSDGDAPTNVMCYVKCILDEFDALDGDVLKEDLFLDYFTPHLGEQAKEFYDLCKDQVGEGKCETPFKIAMCLRNRHDIFHV